MGTSNPRGGALLLRHRRAHSTGGMAVRSAIGQSGTDQTNWRPESCPLPTGQTQWSLSALNPKRLGNMNSFVVRGARPCQGTHRESAALGEDCASWLQYSAVPAPRTISSCEHQPSLPRDVTTVT